MSLKNNINSNMSVMRDSRGRFIPKEKQLEIELQDKIEEEKPITRGYWLNVWFGVLLVCLLLPIAFAFFGELAKDIFSAIAGKLDRLTHEFPRQCRYECATCNFNACWRRCTCHACAHCLYMTTDFDVMRNDI